MNVPDAMPAPPWQSMFDRLSAAFGRKPDPADDGTEMLIPASVYHDPVRHETEMARLFRRLPVCLGHADQLRDPGGTIAHTIAGVPLLLSRDQRGEVGVFVNACRHRGARLVTREGEACHRKTLSCLYHGWTYGLDGSLLAVPRQDAFPTLDRAARGLRRLPSAIRHGLIWTILDPSRDGAPDMASYLGCVDADLADRGLGRHRFYRQHITRPAANWKLMIEAFLEVYHVKRLHADTIGPFFVDTEAVSDHLGPHQRMLVARDGFAALRATPPPSWDPQAHGTLVHLIFPNSVIVYHPDYISHISVFPMAPDSSLFVHTMLTPEPPENEKARAHWDRSFALIDEQVFNSEDLFICEQIQRGLAAGADDTFQIGRFEANLRRFHETIDTMMVDAPVA